LLQEARKNDKHRARICAHPDVSDAVHEMVICLLDKCYIRPHLHCKAESLHVLEGTCDLILLDHVGKVLNALCVSSDLPDASRLVRLPAGTFHTLLVRSAHFLFHETTRGPFDPADTVFGDWAPPEGSAECATYVRQLDEEVSRFQRSQT
jgi:cupin fold WbuC family metalloprotein